MITDRQFRDLMTKFNELEAKYAQMSKDIASIKLKLDFASKSKASEESVAQTKKDVTRYRFEGVLYNKRNLVLACIKKYICDTGISDPRQLLETFPDYIQGSLGVIRAAEMAERYSNAENRYFFLDEDVLHLDTGVYVVSKDWSANNIIGFLDIMETLGYEITPITRM